MQFKQLRTEAWKSQDFNRVWTRDLAIPVRRSNQLSYEVTNISGFIATDHGLLDFKSTVQYMKHFIYHFTVSFMFSEMGKLILETLHAAAYFCHELECFSFCKK